MSEVRDSIAIWWRINRWEPKITPVQVVAFTPNFVTFLETVTWWGEKSRLKDRRERRDDIFPTFEEAKSEAIQRTQRLIDSLKEELQRKRTILGQIESLKEQS